MDIYDQVQNCIMQFPGISSWPDMLDIINRRAVLRPPHWQLPGKACLAVGGTQDQKVIQITTILAVLQTSIVILDDLLDGENHLAHLKLSPPERANLAAAFQASGFRGISSGGFSESIEHNLTISISEMLFSVSLGQSWDVQNVTSEDEYWKITRMKSSAFFAALFECGSLILNGETDFSRSLKNFGGLYGEIIQIHDDLGDSLSPKNITDWTNGRSPLPILFAQIVDHPDQKHFLELRAQITSPGALKEAQTILLRSGAVSYAIHQLIQRYKQAKADLYTYNLPNPNILSELLEKTISPVKSLLLTLGLSELID
jgi:geranylgeranyl pyrophosphate synthase